MYNPYSQYGIVDELDNQFKTGFRDEHRTLFKDSPKLISKLLIRIN